MFPRVRGDKYGRWVIAQCQFPKEGFTLCSLCGSVLDDPAVFVWLSLWPLLLIMCGDFNINWNVDLVGTGAKGRTSKVSAGSRLHPCSEGRLKKEIYLRS